ncbi:endonuclease/exonuclease/phosphatase family protein [Vibrio sp. 10N.261.55.A7]|uniref:endonuclease/exonuclease/phosphatase family protein n=1 Tax=Vibrio sp. 10N.261.55.A7 TaxID=1880851 RepID=UPI000C84F99E|nr:endonuclease/exonuclease/phosphatase family protein [Vibrio sp. 10N.261.55.A7]PMJ94774.1 hypothetical protein BCU12_05190 [Vibrio sp. 10N.261.55.A7]
MKQKYLAVFTLILACIGTLSAYSIFNIPSQPNVSTINSELQPQLKCLTESSTSPIDENGQLDVLVWNIYKQNRDDWYEELAKLSESRQLVLLQEASMTESLKGWVRDSNWHANQVEAFKAMGVSAGVLTVATEPPSIACAYTEQEPWLRLPKSALFSLYSLSTGEELAVVNIHAVNFSYGVAEYQKQLSALSTALSEHSGPIIFAGDFNSWSDERLGEMRKVMLPLELKAVDFDPDERTQFLNGLALDHVFYRGMTVDKAEAPMSSASDHNPLIVSFSL